MTGIIYNDDDTIIIVIIIIFLRDDMHVKGGWKEGGGNFAHCERKRLQASLLISDGP